MAGTLTITGKTGSGNTMTAGVFPDVTWVQIDMVGSMITLKKSGEIVSPIDVTAATTVTATKSGNTWTLTIS